MEKGESSGKKGAIGHVTAAEASKIQHGVGYQVAFNDTIIGTIHPVPRFSRSLD
jgi:hypothetical protein